MGKRAEMRRRRNERRGRNRTVILTLVGIVVAIVVIGVVGSLIARQQQTAREEGFTTTDSGLKYKITEEGDGPQPQVGDSVLVQYRGTLEDGTEFDSGEYEFVLGTGMVIAGWDQGIGLLNEGSSASLIIPPDLGYGAQANGDIPANSTLYFDVTLLTVTPAE